MLQEWHGILEVLERVSFILGILFILWGLWGGLAHGAAGAAFDTAELAPDTFTQSNRQLVGLGLITGMVALSSPCCIKNLLNRQGGADAYRGVVIGVS